MSHPPLTAARVREMIHYDPETGIVTRAAKARKTRIGNVVGVNATRYMSTTIDAQRHLLHRLIWLYMTGEWPTQYIDHINGNKLDNQWSNLRDVSHAENMQNMRRACKNNKAGLLGVAEVKSGKFAAKIRKGGAPIHLGVFVTAEEAYEAYLNAKRELHPGCTI